MAVFRRFCRIICGALFALCVVFTSQNSFADNGGSCENPYVTEGASCYTVLGASNTWDESGTNTHYLSYNSSGGYYISLPKNTAWCIETEGQGYVWDATANNGDGACVAAGPITCPAHSTTFAAGPFVELPGAAYTFSTGQECIAARIYGRFGTYLLSAMNVPEQYQSLYQLAQQQDTFDSSANLNEATFVGIAFCKYNQSTGNYDGACTDAIDICSGDVHTMINNVSANTTSADIVGPLIQYFEAQSETTISPSNYGQLFVNESNNIGYQSFCPDIITECPDGTFYDGIADCISCSLATQAQCSDCVGDVYYWNNTATTCQFCDVNNGYEYETADNVCHLACDTGYSWSSSRMDCVDENGCTADEEYDNNVCHLPCQGNYSWDSTNGQCGCPDGTIDDGTNTYNCLLDCSSYGEGYYGSNGECVRLCPEHSYTLPSGPVLELPGQAFDFNRDGNMTQDECVAARGYSNGLFGITEEEGRTYPTGDALWGLYHYQGIYDDDYSLNETNLWGLAFCRYNTNTENYDGDCTKVISLCDDNEIIEYLETAEPTTLSNIEYFVDLMEVQTGQSIPLSSYYQLFTEDASDIQSLNRCEPWTPNIDPDSICPAFSSTFTMQSNAPAIEVKAFGDSYDFNNDGEITIDECITTHIYGSSWMDFLVMYSMNKWTASSFPFRILAEIINYSEYANYSQMGFYTRLVKKYASGIDLMFTQLTYPGLALAQYGSLDNMPPEVAYQLLQDINMQHVAGFSICRYNPVSENYDTNCTPIIQACNRSDIETLDASTNTTQTVASILQQNPNAFAYDIDEVPLYNQCSCTGPTQPDEFCYHQTCPAGWTNYTGYAGQMAANLTNEALIWGCAPIRYDVYLNSNGDGDDITYNNYDWNSTLLYGTEYTLPDTPFGRTGYIFSGWNTESDGSGTPYTNEATIENLTTTNGDSFNLYAQWTQRQYSVPLYQNVDANNDTENARITATFNAAMPSLTSNQTPLSAPTRNGYNFGGYWSVRDDYDSGLGNMYYDSNMNSVRSWDIDSENPALYARWNLAGYYITYNGEENATYASGTLPTTYDITSGGITIYELTKPGYTFLGWCDQTNPNCTPSGTTYTIADGSTGDITLYAKWTADVYTISYNNVNNEDFGENAIHPTNYTIESADITISNPTREGYTFGGWTVTTAPYEWGTGSSESGDTSFVIATGTYGNITFSAQWTDLYTITYHLNGGTNHENNPSTYTIEDTPLTLLAATKEGFMFGGWCTDSELTTCDTNIIDTANVGNKELWAKWNELSNTFVVNISATDTFEFIISAACSFTVDWGDGRVESYTRLTHNDPVVYSHTYRGAETTRPHSIVITPTVVNGYSTDLEVSTITFNSENEFVNGNARKITSVSGSLGAIFPTIDTPTVGQSQPRFLNTFMGATNMTGTIAKDFFGGVSEIDNNTVYGVHGQPTENMFKGTFYGCESLTGNINKDWFNTLDGTPTTGLFENTFRGCASLSGQIPGGLFSRIHGDIAPNTFAYTFADCSNLTPTSDIDTDNPNNNGILPYAIPANLFSTITGTPQSKMFAGTFSGCSGLYGSIPGSLFGNVAGEPAPNMFENTFAGDFALSGWLPANLFSKISGNPAEAMMTQTFMGCTRLDGYIPPTMFAGISNEHDDAATDQMLNIFYNSGIAESCTNYPQTEQYITGFESYFTSKVSCVSVLPVDIPLYWNRSANDNEIYQTVSVRAGLYMPLKDTSEQSLTMPTNPGYTFVGYFTERNGGESYYTLHNLDEYPLPPPSVNYIYAKVYNGEFNALYAHWVPVQNVALIQNNQYGGTEQVNATIDASKGVLLPEYDNTPQKNRVQIPTRDGYTFAGYWDKNAQNPLHCGWFSYIHNDDGEVVAARLDNSGTDVKTCMLCFAENDCHPFGAEINIHGGRNSIPDIYTYPERLYHLSNGYHGYNYYYEGGEVEYRQYLWVRDRESTIWPYSPEDNVTKLYAQWSPEQHVTLYRNTPDDPNDNEIVGEIVTYPGFFVPYEYIDVTDNNGKTTQQPNPAIIPSRQGYIFMGYSLYPTGGPSFYTSHDYNSDFDGSYNIYHRGLWIYDNVTELYAQWEPAQNVQLIQNDPNDVEEVVNDTIEVYFNVAMPSKNIGDEYIQIPTRNDDYRFVEYCVAEDQILPNYKRKECFYNETDNYMLRSANLVKIEGDSIQPIGGTVDYWLYSTEDGVTKLYAKWEPKQTVQLIRNAPNDTEDIVNDTVYVYKNFYLPSKNTSEQNLTAPTLTGYRFKGYWEDKETEICPSESDPNKECNIYYYNGGFSEEFAIHTNANGGTWPHNPEDNVTKLYAHWVPNQRVNLHLNNPDDNSGNDIIAEIIVNEGFYMPDKDSSGNMLQKPIREGFVFTGFFTDPITEEGEAYCSGFKYGPNCFTGGDDHIKWTYSVEDNVTDLYAHWIPNSYVIGYVLGPGAQNDPDNPTEYTSADEDITIKEPTRPGYEFIGWCDNTNPECEPNNNSPYVIPHGGSKGDVMLYANWSPASYTVTYNCGDGARGRAPDPYVVVFNSTFTPSANTGCIKLGYNFGGWAVSGTSDKKTPDSSFVWDYNENKTFTAVWVIRACPDGYFKPDEENYPSLCYPHRLHAGDNIVYLKDYKTTTPSLNVLLDNGNCRRPENCTFYANMTTDPTYMSMNYEHYLKMMYNGTLYYVCDDTTYGDPTAAGPDATAKQTCEANENYVWTGGGCKTHQEACLANGKVWYAEACYTNMNAYCVETSGTGFVWDEDTSTCVTPDNTEPNT